MTENKIPISTITVKKNGEQWVEKKAVATLNTSDSIISIIGSQDNETFTIRFNSPHDVGNIQSQTLYSYSQIAPFFGSAAVVDAYHLDPTYINMVKIFSIENKTKRFVGEFYLHLKKDKKYGEDSKEIIIYQGRFDVRLEDTFP